ncbi:tyrosine-type recombinase/integrase [Ureibacillus chungkukjangi]|uniref:Site-specific recombinase XerD n=1 Tax=Ureibacillus chungkukjangi TaxID=1202712 RepID=A0A318TN70_9BACL|nr:site-specific integrase [Ureibacillus chungkukjangi]PYF05933.1 site-specific recombinase XerD [Ureibacillus chungkukjangi]
MTNKSKYHPAIKEYKLKNGSKYYRFTVYLGVDPFTGKDATVTRSKFPSQKAAQVAIDRLKYEFNNGKKPENMRKTFSEVYEEWDVLYKNSGIVMSTYSKTEGYFNNYILPFFGHMKVSKITADHCEEFVSKLSSKLKYFHHIISYASDVLDRAIRKKYINSNPFNIIKIPKESIHVINENYLNIENLKLLTTHLPLLDLKVHALLRLLIFTGIRKGELLVLKWGDVDFKMKTLNIYEAYSYSKYNNRNNVGPTKSKHSRTIFLDDITLNILKQWQQEQNLRLTQLGIRINKPTEQLIFNNSVNSYLKSYYPNEQLTEVLEALKLKYITVHGLRHTHATHLGEAHADFVGIQNRLGHLLTKNTTTEHYLHVTDKIKWDTLNSLLTYYKEHGIN